MSVDAVAAPSTNLSDSALSDLRTSIRGQVVLPTDSEYDAARRVWNGMIDRHPALVVRCAGVADVVAAVKFARANTLEVAVRSGAHNVAGFGTSEGGMVIDLGPMKGVRIDVEARTATAQAGLTWGEFDHETQALGLATTGGLVSTTGLGGFTLGGGIGWLLRKYGLTCDNLLGADLVTAEGELVNVTSETPELLWGLRGGGGNFGVVTSFEYQLHAVGPLVLGGAIFHTGDRATELLQFYRDWVRTLPDELTTLFAFLIAPPEPFIPPVLVGKPLVAVLGCYAGPIDAGQPLIDSLRAFGPPAVDLFGPIPYVHLQRMFDAAVPHGIRSYWKTAYLDDLSDPIVDTLVEYAGQLGALFPATAIHLHHAEGAFARSNAAESAFGRRDARFILNLPAAWPDASQDASHIAWVRACFDAIRPLSSSGAYLNFLAGDDEDRVRAAYGPERYARLARLKARYDPTNVFRLNQNIQPAAEPLS
jgi:FAD/FMN-containing dehydrogenase